MLLTPDFDLLAHPLLVRFGDILLSVGQYDHDDVVWLFVRVQFVNVLCRLGYRSVHSVVQRRPAAGGVRVTREFRSVFDRIGTVDAVDVVVEIVQRDCRRSLLGALVVKETVEPAIGVFLDTVHRTGGIEHEGYVSVHHTV